jgi:molybdate-binding protein
MSSSRIPKHVRHYKELLRRVLDSRPSGTRQRLAEALGTNRSFVSQISSSTYKVPIPTHHIDAAHPNQRERADDGAGRRTIQVTVPDLGSARANRLVDEAVRDMARNIIRIVQEK